jgi:hypothetical protein
MRIVMDTRQGLTSAQTGSKGLDKRDQADERGDYEWMLESDGITISLGAPGFTQYLRRQPVHCPGHALSVEERGGFSLDRRATPLTAEAGPSQRGRRPRR